MWLRGGVCCGSVLIRCSRYRLLSVWMFIGGVILVLFRCSLRVWILM